VVSHDDPSVPNWLDPSGYSEGYITFRWIGTDHYPRPECTLLEASALSDTLPINVKRITPEQRRLQLADRRTGILHRYPS